jgi:hypothetical protein
MKSVGSMIEDRSVEFINGVDQSAYSRHDRNLLGD